jgi:leucyl aminopeptidase
LFTNNNPFRRNCKKRRFHWERLWLPPWDVYKQDIESDIADVKNYSENQRGAISGEILEYFTEEHPAWAHLDVAGVALR